MRRACVSAERDAYERVPILPAAVVRLMILSTDDRQLPTQTRQVTLHGVGSSLRRTRDVPNDQQVVLSPPLLVAPGQFSQVSAMDAQAPLYQITD